MALVRVFISSVRGGLEAERDALPGLVKAIGHEPVRFEDFTAQPDPSRQACMDGVDGSDAYMLLLGPRYGHTFPDTGQSPTHDEYMRARIRGIPKLVFLKEGPTAEPEQAKLIEQIRDYASGSFYDSFSGVADLLEKVAQAIRGLESGPTALTWEPLPGPPDFTWRSDWADPRQGHSRDDPIVELHAMPLPSTPIPARILSTSHQRLINALRQHGSVAAHTGLQPEVAGTGVTIAVPDERHYRYDELRPRQLRGVRLDRSGQVSVWWTLPRDTMGGILNEADLVEAFTEYLRWMGAIGVEPEPRYAVAAGVAGFIINIAEGPLSTQPRNSATFGSMSDEPVRVLPDESVSSAVFDRGAPEVATDLTHKLLAGFRSRC
jgi:hypothetical protein